MLNKTIQAPTAKRKCQNKTWHHHLGKLQGKSGRSLSHDISGKKEGERAVSFPFLSPGRQTPQTPAHSPQGGPLLTMLISLSLFNSRATPCFLCVSHSFHNEHRYCYNQEEKTIYMLKIWQGTSAFKIVTLGHVFTSPLIQRFFEMIQ